MERYDNMIEIYFSNKSKKKCMKCGSKKGMIFTYDNGVYSIGCGDQETRCELDIRFRRKKVIDEKVLFDTITNEISELRESIVGIKTDYIYNYIDESNMVKQFQILKEQLKVKQKLLDDLRISILNHDSITCMQVSNDIIDEYLDMTNIKDAIAMYKDEIIPIIESIGECYELNKDKITTDIRLINKNIVYEHVLQTPEIISDTI